MIVYKTTNLANDKIYIGKDKHNNTKYLGSGKRLAQAIKKYGKEHFIKEVLEYCESESHMCQQEKYWISYYKSYNSNIGYNLTRGGDGGDTFTGRSANEQDKTRALLSERSKYYNNLNRRMHSENTKKLWQDPVYAAKVKENVKKAWQNPLVRDKHRNSIIRACNTKEMRELRSKNATGSNNSKWIGYAYLYDTNMNLVKKYECIGYLRKEYTLLGENNKEIRAGSRDIIVKSSKRRVLPYAGYRIIIMTF
jgi:group I intron endonuclease